MAGTAAILRRILLLSPSASSSSTAPSLPITFSNRFLQSPSPSSLHSLTKTLKRLFSSVDDSYSSASAATPQRRRNRITQTVNASAAKTNFSLSDASDSESEANSEAKKTSEADKTSKLPPPYDPFSKKPAIREPEDPKNLQEIFHNMRSQGLFDNAVKMFDALSKDGRTHEALQLFSQIKEGGGMPDVVAYTAVIEAYANAGGGQSKEALKVFLRMLASGVAPNAYTYAVLIKGLAADARLKDARTYVMKMMGSGMRPNPATYAPLFESFVKEGKVEEGRQLLEEMKAVGFVPDEKAAVEEALKDRRGQVYRGVMNLLFGSN